MYEYVQQLVDQKQIGVIHAQNFYTTKYVNPNWQGLKIHYKENVEGNVLLRYANASSNPIKKLLLWMEGHRTRRFEINACKKFDRVLSISPLDRDTLNSLNPALSVIHQSPGVDLDEYPYNLESTNDPVAVFTGTLSYYPNVDGVLYFLQHCWQNIRNQIPQAKFFIVGSNPPEAILRYHNQDGITVTGRVPDIQPYIDQAQVYLVPLRVGGGIRLKILEAMSAGSAIVSTPVGCEGLDGEHNKHLMISEMPNDFTSSIIHLFQDHEQRNQLRKNARQLVEDVYDWDKVVHNQIQQYQQWLDEHNGNA
jgi:glycosyltransferase involved in cell wall biosynthesis